MTDTPEDADRTAEPTDTPEGAAPADPVERPDPAGSSPPAAPPTGATGNDPDGADDRTDSSLRGYAELAALGVLSLLAAVAVFRFYTAASRAIDIWISSDFVPVFQAAFNLVVLFLAVAGISVLLRRMHRGG